MTVESGGKPSPDSSGKVLLRSLTGVRGVAAWWVVLYHFHAAFPGVLPDAVWPFAGRGYLAVDLFFELSGFVIALNYANRVVTYRPREYLRFLCLRLARIYPLHLFMLVLFLLNPVALTYFSSSRNFAAYQYDPIYFVLSLMLVQNWGFTASQAWNVPAWSISTEWGAYILFPLVLWLPATRLRTPLSNALLAAVILVALAVVTGMHSPSLGSGIASQGLLRCVLEFAAGVAAFYIWNRSSSWQQPVSGLCFIAALVCFTVYGLSDIPDYAIMPLGFLLLILALLDERLFISRVLSVRAIEAIGFVSYSTYMSHYFVREWVKFLLVRDGVSPWLWFAAYLLGTALASALLYRFIEMPGRRLGQIWTARLVGGRAPANAPWKTAADTPP